MKHTSGCWIPGALAVLLLVSAPVRPADAASPAAVEAAPAGLPPPLRPMTDLEKAAAGCLISAAGTMGLVYAIGPSEFVMTVVGGLIVPSSSPVLFVGLFSTIASMACGAGAAITPAVLWGWRQLGAEDSQPGAAAAGLPRQPPARPDSGGSRVVAIPGGNDMLVAEAPKAAP